MIGWLKKIFRPHPASGASSGVHKVAADATTDPDILLQLAKNPDPTVRRAVARNVATPVQASTLLANDPDVDVRFALAARLVELLPELSEEKYSQLYAYTVQALTTLAQDEVVRIRQALASTLRDYAKAPPTVVAKLARDVERMIAEPILRFCVALADEDLLDILSHHPQPWMISAIAGRDQVSSAVSDAVVATEDIPATGVLLGNAGATLSADTLQKIIDRARDFPDWHKPMALRRELTADLARQLTGFVGEAVLTVLEKRSDFDAPTRHQVADIVERRLAYQRSGELSAAERVAHYVQENRLTPDVLHDAAVWQDWPFFYEAMAARSGIEAETVRRMMTSGAARPLITACYCAGLPVRMCVDFQRIVGKIQPRGLIYAKGGTDYPLTREEMTWQLEFFGLTRPLPPEPASF